MPDGQRLLREYVENGSEAAFRELVDQHIRFVYAMAMRLAADKPHLAEDIVQIVFADLARMARRLSPHVVVKGWLHRHTCYVAATVLRGERRRLARERRALEMNSTEASSSESDSQLPILDAAINRLSAHDRTAIILRFFEQLDYRAIAASLGTSEDAAQKRVTRAVEKLRFILKRRGVALSTAALATALMNPPTVALPVGLAASVSAAALAQSTVSTGLALTLVNAMALTKFKIAAVSTLTIAGLGTGLVFEHRKNNRFRDENRSLQQQLEMFASVQQQNATLSKELAAVEQKQALAREQLMELLRLRNQLALFPNLTNEIAALREENNRLRNLQVRRTRPDLFEPGLVQDDFPKETWKFAGYATPESAFESASWAARNGDVKLYLSSMVPEQAETYRGRTEGELAAQIRADTEKIKGFRILHREDISETEALLTISIDGDAVNRPPGTTTKMKLQRIGHDWRFAGGISITKTGH